MSYYVEAYWPTPQPQIDWIDQEISVATWMDTVVGPSNWMWATGPKNRICVFVNDSKYIPLIKLHYS